ncbi:MAG: ABC transporter permease [Candidatus Cloacimonetes bacterium]|nr:ABC transporter permease [Candidatus Cloacimonadota bacterium]MCF7814889.1 ABC transporter permease [Candidatus Cloacimonadota bacterium]MCF7869212.1 ABC transporter permease [Candidatus Cloacimonadota bacterium]MCF7884639.1 ABC transporter permease [Candidatus Cloacimonadota bacterium]
MIKNYLKVAFRNIVRHKGFSFINITGLAIGMAICILIMLWVQDEYNFDRFHQKADNIYRILFSYDVNGETRQHWRTPPPLARTIKEKYSSIEDAARFHNEGSVLVSVGDKKLQQQAGYTDKSIFNIFTLPFAKGSVDTAFENPNSAVISQEMADNFFPAENPVGKTITINNDFDLNVEGVLKDMPAGSHLQFDFLMQFARLPEVMGYGGEDDWGDFGFNTFVLLPEAVIPQVAEADINTCIEEISPDMGRTFFLQPVSKIHLYNLDGSPGMMIYIYIFSSIAVFILLIACINFMNLSTARSLQRAREIGVRKVVGAVKNQLKIQFISESIIMAFIALIFAIVLVELMMPIFNDLTSKDLVFDLLGSNMIPALLGIAFFTGIISGIYPAFMLSSFKPVSILKGGKSSSSSGFRKVLVVVQFTLSIILIFSTLVVSRQMNFIRSENLGFNKENVIYLPLNNTFFQKSDILKYELLKNPEILCVTRTSSYLGLGPKWSMSVDNWEGNGGEQKLNLPLISVDKDFLKTFDLELVAGEFYAKDSYSEEEEFEWILNESAVKMAGLEDPIGKAFDQGVIKGVVKDFNFRSLHNNIQPLGLVAVPEWDNHVAVRVTGKDLTATLDYIEKVSREIAPNFLFEYRFLDDEFDNLYRSEIRLGRLFNHFAFFAIIISCLGLLGLSAFMIQQRTKEIGIRKVLGSNVTQIVKLLSTDFTKWVVVANLVALPVAYLIMRNWLQSFAYKTDISLLVFIIAGGSALMISLLTVSFLTIKAANINPVDALKYE